MVELDIGDRHHATVPGMGGVESPTQAHLDQGKVDLLVGKPAEGHRGENLELGRLAMAGGYSVGRVEHLSNEPGERVRINQATVHLESLAVADQVGLGRLTDAIAGCCESAAGQGKHAALAIGPGHERAANRPLRVTERMQERNGAPQAQSDPEAATILEGPDRLLIRGGAHITPWSGLPRRRRTG